MTLNEAILAKLADWRPNGRQSLLIPDSGTGWTVSVTADRSDELGCLLWETTTRRSAGPREEPLRAWADRVAQRVTGLLEPLAVIEVDATRSEAVLRSETPARRGEDVQYYELLLRGGHAARLRQHGDARTVPAGPISPRAPTTPTDGSGARLPGRFGGWN